MRSKTYSKYIWLLNTLLTNGPLTIDEINRLWEAYPAYDGPIALSTFHEHRKGVREMFGVDIVCDRSTNVYYVKNPEVLDEKKLGKWLLDKYSIPKDFTAYNGLKDRVLLEEIPYGQTFLKPIIEAMQNNLELKIDYQRYENEQKEEHLQTFHIQPYALKVYNRRWYLLGYLKEHEGLRNIALDRILNLKVLKTTFELPVDFDARGYYANVVGIFVNDNLPVTKVKIRAYGVQADYLRSTPLHKSQSETYYKRGEFAEFTYRLCVTPELISQLLAMGDKIEVLEPEELRETIKERFQLAIKSYLRQEQKKGDC